MIAVLGSNQIRKLIETKNLITNYTDIEIQLQPTGFDFCLDSIDLCYGPSTIILGRGKYGNQRANEVSIGD